ncbi:MAG: hypothetical protein IPK82_27975 [Polyangiaceae bacterium]|nr:hypothetical protein [Polyangiaceae bacterium]
MNRWQARPSSKVYTMAVSPAGAEYTWKPPHLRCTLAAAVAAFVYAIASSAWAHPPPATPNPLDPPYIPPPAEPPPPVDTAPPDQDASTVSPDEPPEEEQAAAHKRRAIDPAEVTGIVTPERERGDTMREVGNVLLAPPRESFAVLFTLTRTMTVLAEQQQLVPKLNQFTKEKRGEITLFPTMFFDPGRRPSVGGFMVTGGPGGLSTSLRVGTGGPNEALLETRIALARSTPLPFTAVAEALYDMRTSLQYLGLGQDPEKDLRNRFRDMTRYREARYRHQRVRAIVSGGIRPSENTELFVSSSYTTHIVDDSPDDGGRAMSFVFQPGSVPGGPPTFDGASRATIVYSEVAARLDTRIDRGAPREGAFAEGYLGYAAAVNGSDMQYGRFGFRGALFLSLYRKTNIIAPKLVVDWLQPLNRTPIPFYELARETDFRGFHTRRDQLSTTASLDYRWGFAPQISGRLFVDVNTVGSELAKLGLPRWAVGFGMDIYASLQDIGSWAFSFSPDGVGFFLSFGVPNSFGDRQHKE